MSAATNDHLIAAFLLAVAVTVSIVCAVGAWRQERKQVERQWRIDFDAMSDDEQRAGMERLIAAMREADDRDAS